MADDVRHAFLKILYYTLLSIRATKNGELIFVLSDHAHNIPDLIDGYTPDKFRYYWEVERPCFLRAIERLGQPFGLFQEQWTALERHYESLQHHNVAEPGAAADGGA